MLVKKIAIFTVDLARVMLIKGSQSALRVIRHTDMVYQVIRCTEKGISLLRSSCQKVENLRQTPTPTPQGRMANKPWRLRWHLQRDLETPPWRYLLNTPGRWSGDLPPHPREPWFTSSTGLPVKEGRQMSQQLLISFKLHTLRVSLPPVGCRHPALTELLLRNQV